MLTMEAKLSKSDPAFCAQYGEDIILSKLFSKTKSGYAVEVGAFDGRAGSNSAYFDDIGWKCVLVEPNPALARRIRELRPNAHLYECAAGAHEGGEAILHIPQGAETLASVSEESTQMSRMLQSASAFTTVTVMETTLDHILSDAGARHVDFITIDVEGHELEVLRGFSLGRWKPRVVIIEDNSSGTSDEVLNYMRLRGYVRVRNTGCNDWYCSEGDKALARPFPIICTEFKKALKGIKKVVFRHARRVAEVRDIKAGAHLAA